MLDYAKMIQGHFGYVLLILFLWVVYNAARQSSQQKYIQNYKFHPAIKNKLKNKHPHFTDHQLELVFQALRDYLHICNQAGARRMVSMPSQVVDDAWHEFILFTGSYGLFCRKAFGRFLHHTPAEAMRTPTQAQDGIKRAWRLACRKAGINPQTPETLPLLFAIDTQLAIPNGFIYNLHCGWADSPSGSRSYCVSDIGCGGGCSSGDGGGDGCGGGGCGGGGD
jgi:hypothetical protein